MTRTPSTPPSHKVVPDGKRASEKSASLPVPRELLTAGMPLDADLEIERQHRMESLKAELNRMWTAGGGLTVIDRMLSLIIELERENERLAFRVLRANRYRFGRSTEKLSREVVGTSSAACGRTSRRSGATRSTASPGGRRRSAPIVSPCHGSWPKRRGTGEEEIAASHARRSPGQQRAAICPIGAGMPDRAGHGALPQRAIVQARQRLGEEPMAYLFTDHR